MASDMLPIPLPPRTPSPLEDDDLDRFQNSPTKSVYDPMALSPMDENFPINRYASAPAFSSTTLQFPGPDSTSMYSPMSVQSNDSVGSTRMMEDGKGVFNFQPMSMAKAPNVKSNVGQRRGHKYKHSSVSHNFFLEPEPRAPLALPNSLDVPTLKECRGSMTRDQKFRFGWSIGHMVVAAYILWSAEGSLALTALSHLILFDALGALLCVVVDILSNFEVWKRSSIRHPFGLERAEVLAGFAMSVFLLFMGMDLISHNLTHSLEGVGSHEAHHPHDHKQRVSAGEVDSSALLAVVATLVSALGLKNHARIGKVMRFAAIESLPSILANPSHFLTISCSVTMLVLPLLSITVYQWFDLALCTTMALCMCILGVRLVRTIGYMLLMSYDSSNVADIMRDIESDPSVAAIEGAKFWQVHYGLCMACLTLRVRGSEEGLSRLRDKVTSLVRNRLGGGYGGGGARWEVSVQFDMDRF